MFSKVFKLLDNATSVTVHRKQVPQDELLPAISFHNIGLRGDRLLSGQYSGEYELWQAVIVYDKANDLKPIIDELKALDNTKNSDFSKIYVSVNSIENTTDDAFAERAFVDLILY